MRVAETVIEPARILVVDDDVKLLRLLAIRLRRAGWLIETVENGRQALAAIPRFRPQVVVTDVRMGIMDGMALFEALHSQHPTLPVIILTAHGPGRGRCGPARRVRISHQALRQRAAHRVDR